MHTPTRVEAIKDQLARELRGSALVVEEVRVQPAGKRRLVRVTVARDVEEMLRSDPTSPAHPVGPQQPVAPPSLDEVATASRTVAEILERSDLMGAAPYTLEVSSPGADQPLSAPAQFRRNVGRLLTLTYADGTSASARLLAATTQGVCLSTAPQELVDYNRVERARVEIEFSRPGSGEDH